MNRWVKHAAGWFLVALGGVAGYVLFEYAKHHVLKGLGFAMATILIDVGILFLHEDLKKWRAE